MWMRCRNFWALTGVEPVTSVSQAGTDHIPSRHTASELGTALLTSLFYQGYHHINWDNQGFPGLVTCGPERVGTGATSTGLTCRPDLCPVLGQNQPPQPQSQTWSEQTK